MIYILVELVGRVRGLSGIRSVGYLSDFFFEFLSIGEVFL